MKENRPNSGKSAGGERRAPRTDKPRSFEGGKPRAPRAAGTDKPRSFGDAKPRSFGDGKPRSFGDAKPRSFEGGKPRAPRAAGADKPRSFEGAKPRSFEGGKPRTPRAPGTDKPRSFGDAKPRSFGDGKPRAPRAPGTDKPCSFGDAKPRSFGDAKPRSFEGGKPRAPRPRREEAQQAPKTDLRKVALLALSDVARAGAYSTLALNERLRTSTLSLEDKRLATAMFYAALENRIRISYVLSQFTEHMPDNLTEDILHLAVAQILFLDRIPDHAIVDEAVKAVKAYKREAVAPFVNGTLRSILRARDEGKIEYPDRAVSAPRYISIMNSVPEPLTTRLINDYGIEEAEKMISYRPDERAQVLRPNLMKMDAEAFGKYLDGRGFAWEKGIAPLAFRVKGAGDIAGDPDFRAGLFSLQGEAAMLAVEALDPKRSETILDACAAPGGKSCLIAEKLQGTGRVYAWDLHEHRCELIRAQAKRLRLDNIRVAQRDAAAFRDDCVGQFDRALIDAPCTGLGVMVNKPDIKYRVTEEEIRALADTQKKILHAVSQYVKVGGLIVYATCTVLREENEERVKEFLRTHTDFALDADASFLPAAFLPFWKDGMIQLEAHRDGVEGFFIAKIRRLR